MAKGYNKAEPFGKMGWLFESQDLKKRPCVFLSHKKEDKSECRKIAEYFKEAEIDYYLDEMDTVLQQATYDGDYSKITESLKKGIRESTHMLVVVSKKTYESQWVPFEIGYGHSAILDKHLEENNQINKIRLSILTLKDISREDLPDFMKIGNVIRGTTSLNKYISSITQKLEKSLINETRIFSSSDFSHPLDDVLDWSL